MTFIYLLSTAKNVYSLCRMIENTFTDQVSEILRQIAQKEMVSAIKTLDDSKISNNPEREFISAVTQLRLALEKN